MSLAPLDKLVMADLPHLSEHPIMFYGVQLEAGFTWTLSDRQPTVPFERIRTLVCPHCGAREGASDTLRLQLDHYNKRLWNVWCPGCCTGGPRSEFPDIALSRYCSYQHSLERTQPDTVKEPE